MPLFVESQRYRQKPTLGSIISCDYGHRLPIVGRLHFLIIKLHLRRAQSGVGFLCNLIHYCTLGDLMQSRSASPPAATRFCWICGRPISLENSKTDEHGSIVHTECQTARLKLEEAGSSLQEKQK